MSSSKSPTSLHLKSSLSRPNQLDYSISEINSNKFVLKSALVYYSTNVKSYAKWFEIGNIIKNEDTYTVYQVIYRFLPKDLNEITRELVTWKRFRDFKELYNFMCDYHVSLHRKDTFPEFAKPKIFGRFNDKVIEERKQCSLKLLQFIGTQGHLYRHEKFIEFLSNGVFRESVSLIDETNILKPTSILTPTKNSQSSLLKVEQKKTSPPKSMAPAKKDMHTNTSKNENLGSLSASEWELSDFNLMSIDFNNDLKFMNGDLKDLNRIYKLVKVLNSNCYLVEFRNSESNEKFVIKKIQKSLNPNVIKKSIVPFNNRIPFMCQLITYYESDDSIFLLLEYFKLGKLYCYLDSFYDNPDSFLKELANLKTNEIDQKLFTLCDVSNRSYEVKQIKRRTSLVKSNSLNSLDSHSPFLNQKRRAQSSAHTDEICDQIKNVKLTEVELSKIQLNDEPNAALSASSVSLSSSESIREISDQNERTDNAEEDQRIEKSSSPTRSSASLETDSTYSNQVKIWLAQLFLCIKNLHQLEILIRDLNASNILLSNKNQQACLTFTSKWNLVDDEKLDHFARKNFYTAPELNGRVNFSIRESCDWWSYGVLCYEMLTCCQFSSMHEHYHLCSNRVNFPAKFKCIQARDLIENLLKFNPNERINETEIEKHSFFSNIDWISLEQSFWN